MAGYAKIESCAPTILGVNTAVNFGAGVPGVAGVANDTIITRVVILKNAGPATLTFNSGFQTHAAAQDTTHYVLTGSTTADTIYQLNWRNSAGALQMTASVANMVIVETMAA